MSKKKKDVVQAYTEVVIQKAIWAAKRRPFRYSGPFYHIFPKLGGKT